MKLYSLIGAAMALACITAFSTPAMSAVTPDTLVPFEQVLAAPADDCLASFEPSTAILFVSARDNCDATMIEMTGLCLTPIAAGELPLRVTASLDPVLGATCTMRPSPPG